MAYRDSKSWNGTHYTGMAVGAHHSWRYVDALWRERKVSPTAWDVRFSATKERLTSAPDSSGASVDSCFRWEVRGVQEVRKLDANAYETLLVGSKRLAGFRKPGDRDWTVVAAKRPPRALDASGQAVLF